MEAFAQRAASELLATGETARTRTVETSSDLTAQEAQIVRFVREGPSNPEIAERLFLSTRTAEWHMGKIFGKLGITPAAPDPRTWPAADREPPAPRSLCRAREPRVM
jgi:DNA-binding NarL/FixJ family response regulator